jgi:hypothetical protein
LERRGDGRWKVETVVRRCEGEGKRREEDRLCSSLPFSFLFLLFPSPQFLPSTKSI